MFAMEDFRRQFARESFRELTPEERREALESLPPDEDRPQLVVATQGAVLALDPRSDKTIWSCKWAGNRYPSLVADSRLVYVTGDGGESLAIDPTGEGDVSKTH